jgi:hypothetical protein
MTDVPYFEWRVVVEEGKNEFYCFFLSVLPSYFLLSVPLILSHTLSLSNFLSLSLSEVKRSL